MRSRKCWGWKRRITRCEMRRVVRVHAAHGRAARRIATMTVGSIGVAMTSAMAFTTAAAQATPGSVARTPASTNPKPQPPRLPGTFSDNEPVLGTHSDRADILVRVAQFRRDALGDTARIEFCNAAKIVVDSTTLLAALAKTLRGTELFGARSASCIPVDQPPRNSLYFLTRRTVVVDSVRVHGPDAKAFVGVRDHEHWHREVFRLVQRGTSWTVAGSEILGVMQLR